MNERPRLRLLLPALLLVLLVCVLAAVLLWTDWIADVLVVRAAYYLWLVGLVIRSRPQALYWALPIVVGVAAAIVVLVFNLEIRRNPKSPAPTVGRVAEWAEWLKLASVTPYFNKYLHRKIVRLTERALQLEAYRPEGRADEAAPLLMPTLPPTVQALLDERLSPLPSRIDSLEAETLQVIVDYLESVLEVDHD